MMFERMLATLPPPPGYEWTDAWEQNRPQIVAEMEREFEERVRFIAFLKNPFMKLVERLQGETHA